MSFSYLKLDTCQKIYHYHKYPDKYKSILFTKSELLESIDSERAVYQIKRKK